MKLKYMVSLIMGFMVAMVLSSPAEAQQKRPFEYEFVDVHVTCHPEYGQSTRLLITSQIFGWCYGEFSAQTITDNDHDAIGQTAQASCGLARIEVTWSGVFHFSTHEAAQNYLNQQRMSGNFDSNTSYFSGAASMYSNQCQ